MRRNRVEGELIRPKVFLGVVFIEWAGLVSTQIDRDTFRKLFGFTPRPGKKIKIVLEIQEEAK